MCTLQHMHAWLAHTHKHTSIHTDSHVFVHAVRLDAAALGLLNLNVCFSPVCACDRVRVKFNDMTPLYLIVCARMCVLTIHN